MGGKRWPEWVNLPLYSAGLDKFDGAKALAMVVFNHVPEWQSFPADSN
jgi:hypothetical protein